MDRQDKLVDLYICQYHKIHIRARNATGPFNLHVCRLVSNFYRRFPSTLLWEVDTCLFQQHLAQI